MNQNGNNRKNSYLTRKRLIAVAFSLLLAVVIFTGASFAFLHMNSGPVQNTFSKGSVGADIEEVFTNNVKSSITVKNTGDSPAYVRVRLVTYWQDAAGNILVKDTQPSISLTLGSGWSQLGEYYYYTQPVSGGTATGNLLGSNGITLVENQVIDVIAEVVQATPDGAVTNLWGEAALKLLKQ